jgi:hypothetical protein
MLFIGGARGIQALRQRVAANPRDAQRAKMLLSRAEQVLAANLVEPVFDAARPTFLTTARCLADRVHLLGLAWFLTGQPRFLIRLSEEAQAACAFENWNRTHFLDVGEMAAAVSVAYAWTRSALTEEKRRRIEAGLYTHALKPGLSSLRSQTDWTQRANNWNLVCCGGLVLTALSLLDRHPQEAQELLDRALDAMRLGLGNYGSEGGWDEGISYWEYATRFAVIAIAALEHSCPERIQELDLSGLIASWRFGRALTTPAGRSVNIGDSEIQSRRFPAYGWLAIHGGGPAASRWQDEAPGDVHPLDLLWPGTTGEGSPPPAIEIFATAGYATLRGGGTGYVAARAGRNDANHAHLDLGSLVYERDGAMLIADPGRGDYAAPGYFRVGERQRQPNVGTAVHSTIRFDGHDQSLGASARFIAHESGANIARLALIVDDPAAPCLHARAIFLDNDRLAIADRIVSRSSQASDMAWSMTSAAIVTCEGDVVWLVAADRTWRLAWHDGGPLSPIRLDRTIASTDHGEGVLTSIVRGRTVERETWITATIAPASSHNAADFAEACRAWLARMSDPMLT